MVFIVIYSCNRNVRQQTHGSKSKLTNTFPNDKLELACVKRKIMLRINEKKINDRKQTTLRPTKKKTKNSLDI